MNFGQEKVYGIHNFIDNTLIFVLKYTMAFNKFKQQRIKIEPVKNQYQLKYTQTGLTCTSSCLSALVVVSNDRMICVIIDFYRNLFNWIYF